MTAWRRHVDAHANPSKVGATKSMSSLLGSEGAHASAPDMTTGSSLSPETASTDIEALRPPAPIGPEVYLGLITPLGVATDELVGYLVSEFSAYGYQAEIIRLSDILEERGSPVPRFPELRSAELIERGDTIARNFNPEAVATLGVQRLHLHRAVLNGGSAADTEHRPRTVWIFRSLKRTEEVGYLRQTYGNAFYALSVYASYDSRLNHLYASLKTGHPSWDEDKAREQAQVLIDIDQDDGKPFGQNVRSAFPMADVILPGDEMQILEHDSRRFVRLLFGDNEVPTASEHAMSVAGMTAALSSSLSRKVGVALTTIDGDFISTGMNEVPKAGGGQYGSDDSQGRDKDVGHDYSTTSLNALVADTLRVLSRNSWLADEKQELATVDLDTLTMEAVAFLKRERADIMGLIEFQRAVHAEISALMSAARRGIPTQGSVLYSTTYPCHLCAKEIVSAGVEKVYWIEPYPKSRAQAMFGESISELMDDESLRVSFLPFIGVTPRAYPRLFTTEEEYRRKEVSGAVLTPPKVEALPRVGALSPILNVMERELKALAMSKLLEYRFDTREALTIDKKGEEK